MASSAAQTYFNSFDPTEQDRIRKSWGGADLMDEWFKNAVGAGAVTATGQSRDPNLGQGMGTTEALAANEAANANVSGSSGLKKGDTPTPAQLRLYAREQGWSEDFNRFNDATLASWIKNNWNPQSMKFRSEKTDESGNPLPGDVEKPVDTPEGWVAWGQKAIRVQDAEARKNAWGQPKPNTQQPQAPVQQQQPQVPQQEPQQFDWTKFQNQQQQMPARAPGVTKTDRTQTPTTGYTTWRSRYGSNTPYGSNPPTVRSGPNPPTWGSRYGPNAGAVQANRALSTNEKFAGPLRLGM